MLVKEQIDKNQVKATCHCHGFFTELPIMPTLRKTGVEKLLPAKTDLVQARTHSIKEN